MASVNLSSYKKLYLQTAKEYCDELSSNYIKISQNSLDKDALKNIYISSHSLKSESQTMGYSKLTALSGMIEKITKNILDNKIQITESLMVVLKEAIESVQASLLNIEKENKELNTDFITKKLEEYNKQFYETHYS